MSSTTTKLWWVTRLHNAVIVSLGVIQQAQADATLAGFGLEGSIWPHGWAVRGAICIRMSPMAASQRERMESLLLFASVVGHSPTAFSFHLHGHNNNRCTGLTEIRLRDPQLQNLKKHNPQSVWVYHCGIFTAKARNNINTARLTIMSNREDGWVAIVGWTSSNWPFHSIIKWEDDKIITKH